MKKTIFLHIGHGKTGTSATQGIFANISDELSRKGVLYPEYAHITRLAKLGGTTSGNAPNSIDEFFLHLKKIVKENSDFDRFCFSNEWFFQRQEFGTIESFINNNKEDFKFSIILSVRNPVNLMISSYKQGVKLGGITEKIDDFNFTVHSRARNIIEFCKENNVEIHLFNYSKLKQKITENILQVICPEFNLKKIKNFETRIVNRSLSKSEVMITRNINKYFGRNMGAKFAERIVKHYPNIEVKKERLNQKKFERYKSEQKGNVDFINSFLGEEDQLYWKNNIDNFGYKEYFQGFLNIIFAVKIIFSLDQKLKKGTLPNDFDPEMYLLLNADVKEAGVNPAEHFLKHGQNENRQYKI